MSTKQDTQSDVVTTIRLDRSQHARLKELAATEHRSLGAEVRMLIERYIAERDAQEAAA